MGDIYICRECNREDSCLVMLHKNAEKPTRCPVSDELKAKWERADD